jgi:uncharacterized protein YbjT (DUF2867 family)
MSQAPVIITVFGGTGFAGRAIINHLARRYPAARLQIRVPTRSLARAEPLRSLGEVGQITPFLCDVRDAGQVQQVVAGSAAVINCIGQLAESRKNRFDLVQGEVPGIIARAIQNTAAQGARFIHLSAIGADANSASKYARSKAAGEGVVRAILPQATILRPSIIFGPEDNFFNRFAKMALLSPVLPLIGGGATQFQPVYVGDVAAAVLAVLENPATEGLTYEIGGPATYSFADLMQLVLKESGRQRRLVNLPWGLARLQAAIFEKLPGKLLTRDQVTLLQHDNIVGGQAPVLAQLGIAPTAVEAILPTYLDRFKPRGRFR